MNREKSGYHTSLRVPSLVTELIHTSRYFSPCTHCRGHYWVSILRCLVGAGSLSKSEFKEEWKFRRKRVEGGGVENAY